jgi:hypothetical protein
MEVPSGIATTDMVRGGAAGKGSGQKEKREKSGRRERRATTAREVMERGHGERSCVEIGSRVDVNTLKLTAASSRVISPFVCYHA